MAQPHKCPICNGTGKAPNGFYESTGTWTTKHANPEPCRTCKGTGIVWEKSKGFNLKLGG